MLKEVSKPLAAAVNIGYTNENRPDFPGDDAGRMLQELFAGQFSAEEFAKAYEQAWNDGMNTGN